MIGSGSSFLGLACWFAVVSDSIVAGGGRADTPDLVWYSGRTDLSPRLSIGAGHRPYRYVPYTSILLLATLLGFWLDLCLSGLVR